MSGDAKPPFGYSYVYHREARKGDEAQPDASQAEDMRYIRETILLLTGGCEVCTHSVGPFCKKHSHPIQIGDPRCGDFARRFPENPETASRAQARQFVNDTLGIKDRRNVRRLAGEA